MFFSKRNQVYPVLHPTGIGVEKHFADPNDFSREDTILQQLRDWPGCAQRLETAPQVITTRFYPGGTVLDELLRQEREGFDAQVWNGLADWIYECINRCGMLPQDCNLRNFLWSENRIIGIDLESYGSLSEPECAAEIIANLLHYTPEGTSVKLQAAALLQARTGVSDAAIRSAEQALQHRRKNHPQKSVSGIILAGGHSSRMGRDKSQLFLGGETMLQRQIRKLQALGITDILISGADAPTGTRTVPDIYPERGPLGGLHACLQAAQNSACLVLSVDVPLVPVSMLHRLCRMHAGGITVLSHNGCDEPLMGIYDRVLFRQIEPLITRQGAPVRRLADIAKWNRCPYLGPEAYLHNCNTPSDYTKIQEILESFSQRGLDFL